MPDNVYGAFDSFERKMDDAIGGFDILDESPAAAATVLVDVKSGRFPPCFDNSCSNYNFYILVLLFVLNKTSKTCLLKYLCTHCAFRMVLGGRTILF